jgi:hypothetical protein
MALADTDCDGKIALAEFYSRTNSANNTAAW